MKKMIFVLLVFLIFLSGVAMAGPKYSQSDWETVKRVDAPAGKGEVEFKAQKTFRDGKLVGIFFGARNHSDDYLCAKVEINPKDSNNYVINRNSGNTNDLETWVSVDPKDKALLGFVQRRTEDGWFNVRLDYQVVDQNECYARLKELSER